MSLVSNIYTIESQDNIINYLDNNAEFYLNPLDIIIDSTFDSTVGSVVGKYVIIKLLNFNGIKSILNPGKLIYANNKIFNIETIGNNDLTCNVIYDLYSGDQDYDLNNTFVYSLPEEIFDIYSPLFRLSGRYRFISKNRSIEFLDSIDLIGKILNKIDYTISNNSVLLNIRFDDITEQSFLLIKNLYLNIWLFSYDIVGNLFNIKIKKSYDIYSGIIFDYTNNIIIRPIESIIISNSNTNVVLDKINGYTSFERQINNTDKMILMFNISTNNIKDSYKYNTIDSLLFYKIIS